MKEGINKSWIIRYSNGNISVHRGGYEDIVRIAEERVRGTDITYIIT